MAKIKQHSKQDAYTTNLLISLLMRFPEIMSVNFDMPHEQAKFTFILNGGPGKEEFSNFNRLLADSIVAYQDLTGEDFCVKAKLTRSGKMNVLELSSCTTTLSLEGIQLICGIVCGAFPDAVIRDAETMEMIHDEEMLRQEEIIEYLLSHGNCTKQDNLIAFRESGKVFVYDK